MNPASSSIPILLSYLDVGSICMLACVNSLWREAAGRELQLRIHDISQGSEPCRIPVRTSKGFVQMLPLDFHYHARLEAEHLPILADAGCSCKAGCCGPSTSLDTSCPSCSCVGYDLCCTRRPCRSGATTVLDTHQPGAVISGHTICAAAELAPHTAKPEPCTATIAAAAPPPAPASARMPLDIPARDVVGGAAGTECGLSQGEPADVSTCNQTTAASPYSKSTVQADSSCQDGTSDSVSMREGPFTECGPACACLPDQCPNRMTQQGVVWQLQLVMGAKGWSVLAAEPIPAGAFVCEYVGERLSTAEAQARLSRYDKMREPLIRYDRLGDPSAKPSHGSNGACLYQVRSENARSVCSWHAAGSGKAGKPGRSSPTAGHDKKAAETGDMCIGASTAPLSKQAGQPLLAGTTRTAGSTPTSPPLAGGHALLAVREILPSGLCLRTSIDATQHGNIARFINHACSQASLDPVVVRRSGALLPAVALFAARGIMAGEELTFSYGKPSLGGNSLARRCFCNTPACLGFLPDCRD